MCWFTHSFIHTLADGRLGGWRAWWSAGTSCFAKYSTPRKGSICSKWEKFHGFEWVLAPKVWSRRRWLRFGVVALRVVGTGSRGLGWAVRMVGMADRIADVVRRHRDVGEARSHRFWCETSREVEVRQ